MRLFEVLILAALLLLSFSLLVAPSKRPRWLVAIPIVTAILTLLHLTIEGARWQMTPAYLLTILFLVLSLKQLCSTAKQTPASTNKAWRISGAFLCVFGLVLSFIVGSAFPVFELPTPSGTYVVSTTEIMLEDHERPEIITDNPDDFRSVMVRVWYPAEAPSGNLMPYMHRLEAEAFAGKYGLPAFMLSHLNRVEPHAYQDLPVANSQSSYPVLVFSHGYNVPPATYASILTDIASHGFIVFAINHTYESTASVFPDGDAKTFDHNFTGREYEGVWDNIQRLEAAYWAAENDSIKKDVVKEINSVYPMGRLFHRWADDQMFLVDELTRINNETTNSNSGEGLFYGKLNLDQLGAFGHSAGGGTSGQVLLSDDRVKAGINLDGAQWGDMIDAKLTKPFLRIEVVRDPAIFAPNDLIYRDRSDTTLYDLKINGAGHSSFSDIPYLIPIRQINEAGILDAERVTEITTKYTLAFFQKYLLGIDTPLLNQKEPVYPEVNLVMNRNAK